MLTGTAYCACVIDKNTSNSPPIPLVFPELEGLGNRWPEELSEPRVNGRSFIIYLSFITLFHWLNQVGGAFCAMAYSSLDG